MTGHRAVVMAVPSARLVSVTCPCGWVTTRGYADTGDAMPTIRSCLTRASWHERLARLRDRLAWIWKRGLGS